MYLSESLLNRIKKGFIKHHLKNRFGWSAEQVAAEKAQGYYTVCLSASSDYALPDLVKDMKFDMVLCSETYARQGQPWKFKFFCYGENKVKKLNAQIKSYKIIRSYSDSKVDMPVMRLAQEEVWIDPKTGCRILS
jgi:phosphoserine phosphatase